MNIIKEEEEYEEEEEEEDSNAHEALVTPPKKKKKLRGTENDGDGRGKRGTEVAAPIVSLK